MPDYLSVDVEKSRYSNGIALHIPCGAHGAVANLTRGGSMRLARDIVRLLSPLTPTDLFILGEPDAVPAGSYNAPLATEEALPTPLPSMPPEKFRAPLREALSIAEAKS